jgi:WD40 repeat protein
MLKEIVLSRDERLERILFVPNENVVLAAGWNSVIRGWDLGNGQEIVKLVGHDNGITALALSSDGKRLVSGSSELFGPRPPTSKYSAEIKVWDWKKGKEVSSFRINQRGIYDVSFSPDGKSLGLAAGQLTIHDSATGKLVEGFPWYIDPVLSVFFNPDGNRLLTGGIGDLAIWDLKNGKVERIVKRVEGNLHDGPYHRVTWSKEGSHFASDGPGRAVYIWDAKTGKLLQTYTGHTEMVTGVAFSPKGDFLASGSVDGTLRLWKVPK